MAELPEAIQQILDECRSSITARGEVPAANREKIYKQLDDFLPHPPSYVAHYWRAKLEMNCALKVLHIWESCELTDNTLRELLCEAEKYLMGELDSKQVEQLKERTYHFSPEVENLMENGPEYFIASYAGFACIAAVYAALNDLDFETLGLPEIENDPDFVTASFLASLACCGGAIWEEGVGDDLKRREFWEWFLNEAVPALWQI